MSYKDQIESIENDVLTIGVMGDDGGYFMWQKGLSPETGSEDGVYFEYDDQKNGGYNIVEECTVTNDGMHVVLTNGGLVHLYFPQGFNKFGELKAGSRLGVKPSKFD